MLHKHTKKPIKTRGYKIGKRTREYIPSAKICLLVACTVLGIGFGAVKMTNLSFAQTNDQAFSLHHLTPTIGHSTNNASSPTASKQPAAVSSAASAQATTVAAPKPASAAHATLAVAASTPTPAAAAVSRVASLYPDVGSNVSTQARAWAANNPNDATVMNRLAATPMATWFGDWNSNVQTSVNTLVSSAAASGKIPTLVAYDIPERDCGSYSAGGATSAAVYQSWIRSFAAGIGQRQAIVIVEPDALAGMDCLSAADQTSRTQLLSYAVQTLASQTKAAVYLDAGNPTWQSASTMATRLRAADVADATGFSLNVSNFETTVSNINYGNSLSQQINGKHYVIDTSRNGNGPASGTAAWCNPDGRAFGETPSLQTNNSLVDAYLWVKGVGESDGTCGPNQAGSSAPAAGAWWPQYALMLANNSGW